MVPHGLLMQMRHHVEATGTDEARDKVPYLSC
jgi:hypothetical protein